MSLEKKVYTYRTRILFDAAGAIVAAEIVRKAQVVEDGKVISEVELDVRSLEVPASIAAEVSVLNAKFETLFAAEEAARKAKAAAEEAERKAKAEAEAKAAAEVAAKAAAAAAAAKE